jgi:phosphatidylglycerol:prolipoprotein diacylglycerol transferase
MDNVNDISFPNLGIYISDLASGITVFGREIKFYAIIIAVSFIIAAILAMREAKKTGQDDELYIDAFLVSIIPIILGARLYYVLFDWQAFRSNPVSVLYIWQGGLAIYGGVLVGLLTLYIFSKVRKQSYGLLLDTLVPGLALGQCLGRWGNFFNREAFGGNCKSLFAMRIPSDAVHVGYASSVTVTTPDTGLSYIQVQPTFLYESVLCLCIFIILLLVRRHKKVNGEVFLLYAFLYGIGRFFIERMRTDQLVLCTIGETDIPVSQVVALIFVVLSVVLFLIGRHRQATAYYLDVEDEEQEETE